MDNRRIRIVLVLVAFYGSILIMDAWLQPSELVSRQDTENSTFVPKINENPSFVPKRTGNATFVHKSHENSIFVPKRNENVARGYNNNKSSHGPSISVPKRKDHSTLIHEVLRSSISATERNENSTHIHNKGHENSIFASPDPRMRPKKVDESMTPWSTKSKLSLSEIERQDLKNSTFAHKIHENASFVPQSSVLCLRKPGLCQYGKDINERLAMRRKFSRPNFKSNSSIFVDSAVTKWYGPLAFLTSASLKRCPMKCNLVENASSADIVVTNLNVPSDRKDNIIYAPVNLEAHSHNLPNDASNIVMISFRQESDIIINYAYTVMHWLNLCVGDLVRLGNCENMEAKDSRFYKWCARAHGGDFFTCVFNIIPHILRTNHANQSSTALAVTWVSASCERHDKYLETLSKYMHIDSMGGCYRNRDEGSHIALSYTDADGLWSEASESVKQVCS
jgi:hypothetical protein